MKEELQKLIQDSSLSEDDKEVWFNGLKKAPEEIAIIIYGFFIEYKDNLGEATSFLKRKLDAVKNSNARAWNNILKDEELFLNNK